MINSQYNKNGGRSRVDWEWLDYKRVEISMFFNKIRKKNVKHSLNIEIAWSSWSFFFQIKLFVYYYILSILLWKVEEVGHKLYNFWYLGRW